MRRLLWTLSGIITSSTTRPTSTFSTRPRRKACERGSPATRTSLWNCSRLDSNPKGLATENTPSSSLARLSRKWQRGRTRFRNNFTSWRQKEGTQQILRLQVPRAQGASTTAASSAHHISGGSTDMTRMGMSMWSDMIQQPSIARTSVVWQCSKVDQQVMDQFAHMKTMLSFFLRPRQETNRTVFCNYHLRLRDFQMFRNEAVTFLSGIQSRTEERTVSLSNLHFLGSPVSLPHMCHRLISSHSNQHRLAVNTSCIFPKLICQQARPPNQLSRARWHSEDISPEGKTIPI